MTNQAKPKYFCKAIELMKILKIYLLKKDHGKLFSFSYNTSNTDNYENVIRCCKDLQLAFTSNYGLSSDINSIELCEEIMAFQRQLKKENNDPQ